MQDSFFSKRVLSCTRLANHSLTWWLTDGLGWWTSLVSPSRRLFLLLYTANVFLIYSFKLSRWSLRGSAHMYTLTYVQFTCLKEFLANRIITNSNHHSITSKWVCERPIITSLGRLPQCCDIGINWFVCVLVPTVENIPLVSLIAFPNSIFLHLCENDLWILSLVFSVKVHCIDNIQRIWDYTGDQSCGPSFLVPVLIFRVFELSSDVIVRPRSAKALPLHRQISTA